MTATTLTTPSMPKIAAPQSTAQPGISARPTPATVPNGSARKPRKETPVPATELAVIRGLTGRDKWHLRGRILDYGWSAIPTQIWRGLTQRPTDTSIRMMTELGHLDEALARALAWEGRHTADLVPQSAPSAQPASPATIATHAVHTSAEIAPVLSDREQAVVDRLLAELNGSGLPMPLQSVVAQLPPISSPVVRTTAAELAAATRQSDKPWLSPAQQAWRDKQDAARAARTSQKDGGEATTTAKATPTEPKLPSRTKRRGKRMAEAERIQRLAHAIDLEALRANSPESAEFVDAVLGLTVDELAGQANAWMSQTVAFLSKLANIIRARQLAGKISLNALREIKPDAAALVDTVLGASFEELVAQPDAWISQAEQSLTILAKD